MTNGPDGLRVLNVFGQLERGGAELRAVELAEAFPPDHVRSDFLVLSGLDGVLDDRVQSRRRRRRQVCARSELYRGSSTGCSARGATTSFIHTFTTFPV